MLDKILMQLDGKVQRNDKYILFDGRKKLITMVEKNGFFTSMPYLNPLLNDETKLHVVNMDFLADVSLTAELIKKIPLRNEETVSLSEQEIQIMQAISDRLVLCHLGADEYFFFDTIDRCKFYMPYETILDRLPMKSRMMIKQNAKPTLTEYDVQDITPCKIIKNVLGLEEYRVNLYRPPAWRESFPVAKPEWEGKPPIEFVRLFKHLITSPEERQIVLSWIYHAMSDRNQSFLHFRGSRGNGKTLFMNMIMGVIGSHFIARDGVNADNFNAELQHKRIVAIDDDTSIGSVAGHKLRKKITNTHVTYRALFKQTTKSEQQFASYMIASNHEDSFHTTWEDRKIVVTDLTSKSATDALSMEELAFVDNDLIAEVQTGKALEWLAQLGHYLLAYGKSEKLKPINVDYKGGYFWQDVIESLPAFKRYVVTTLLKGGMTEIPFDDLTYGFEQVESKGNKMGWGNTKKFLEGFRYKGEQVFTAIDDANQVIFLGEVEL